MLQGQRLQALGLSQLRQPHDALAHGMACLWVLP